MQSRSLYRLDHSRLLGKSSGARGVGERVGLAPAESRRCNVPQVTLGTQPGASRFRVTGSYIRRRMLLPGSRLVAHRHRGFLSAFAAPSLGGRVSPSKMRWYEDQRKLQAFPKRRRAFRTRLGRRHGILCVNYRPSAVQPAVETLGRVQHWSNPEGLRPRAVHRGSSRPCRCPRWIWWAYVVNLISPRCR